MPEDIEYLDDDEFYDDYDDSFNGFNLPHLPHSDNNKKSLKNDKKDDDDKQGEEKKEDDKNKDDKTGESGENDKKEEKKDDKTNENKDNNDKDRDNKDNVNKKNNNEVPNNISDLSNSRRKLPNLGGQNFKNKRSPMPLSNGINNRLNRKLNNGSSKNNSNNDESDKEDNNPSIKKDKKDNNHSKLNSKAKTAKDLFNSGKKASKGKATSIILKLSDGLAKKLLATFSPFIILISLLVLIVVIFLSSNGTSSSIDTISGQINGTIDLDSSDENYEFVNMLKNVNNNYVSQNKIANIPMVISTFMVISMEDSGPNLNEITQVQVETVIEAMFNGNSYNADLYKSNLFDILKSYYPSYSDEKINNMIDDIFVYYDNYVSAYGEPSLAIKNVAVFDAYWWPIGSSNTTNENGRIFAKDNPATVNITSPFGNRVMSGKTVFHSGIDIANGSAAGDVNIIASKGGEVIYPTDTSNISYGTGYYGSRDGGGLGNYVKIRHSDGTITVYGHMYANSITVRAGETVEQGQVIGKMGTSGSSTGVHLHFSIYVGGDSSANSVDPLTYVDPNNPRVVSSGSDFSLTNTVFSEDEFVAKMQDYYNRTGKAAFLNNFLNNAREIYQASADYGVNPELVVVTAATESGFSGCGTTGNYWGIGIPNGHGCSSGPTYPTMRDGVKGYAETLASYNPGGRYADSITNRYNQRSAAGCKAGGYGLPGTLAGMQSIYSWLGDYRYNPGSSGKGGCYYLENNLMYGAGYCSTVPTCSNYSSCPENSRTTVCEQSDYTLLQITQKLKVRQDIFGL